MVIPLEDQQYQEEWVNNGRSGAHQGALAGTQLGCLLAVCTGPHPENLCPKPNTIGMACIQFWPVRGGPGLQFASWRKGSLFP